VGIETDFVVMGMGCMVVMWGWGLSVRECGDGYKVSKCTFLWQWRWLYLHYFSQKVESSSRTGLREHSR